MTISIPKRLRYMKTLWALWYDKASAPDLLGGIQDGKRQLAAATTHPTCQELIGD